MNLKKKMGISVDNYVEVCSKEDGFLGSYYLARVIGKLGKGKFMVQYMDLEEDEDGKKKLKEVVDATNIRPVPQEIKVWGFDVLAKVDAYDCDGWWVGRVTGTKDDSYYYVHFDSSGDEITYPISRLRVHQEYENGRWVPSQQKGMIHLCKCKILLNQ
ncbi:protein AGENET DOMAIN (AGD)-CONTAINING P1-like [Cornus florida]|uniref:protein AGENET DOMAIN (AGD)-CONTAINING P1-like n=1 Tax=Cornus florida TaxID=4283 RepID=UPI0028A230C6|nr:protein AGENET DOMAIN (AGD)-CONTAINING P1-like [Cornus florida]